MVHYAKCRKAINRFLRSGRLGEMGHVSCVVRLPGTGRDSDSEVTRNRLANEAADHLAEVCEMFGWIPESVMASYASRDGAAFLQVFLLTQDSVDLHCFVGAGDSRDEHELWLEGSQSSLRTDGNRVLWRNRGWPVFVPVRFGLFGRGRKSLSDGSQNPQIADAVSRAAEARAICPVALQGAGTS